MTRTGGWIVLWESSQAAFLVAGCRFDGPEKLPFGRPGDLPRGFGAAAGVSKAGRSVAKLRNTRYGVSFEAASGFSQVSLQSATTYRANRG